MQESTKLMYLHYVWFLKSTICHGNCLPFKHIVHPKKKVAESYPQAIQDAEEFVFSSDRFSFSVIN